MDWVRVTCIAAKRLPGQSSGSGSEGGGGVGGSWCVLNNSNFCAPAMLPYVAAVAELA